MGDQKFDLILAELQKINGRVTKIENRVTNIDERITKVDERVMKIDERVTKIDETVTATGKRVTSIETEQHRHGEHIQQLIQIVRTTNQNLEEFQQNTIKRFERVERSLHLVESDLDLILQKSNVHERDINRLLHVD